MTRSDETDCGRYCLFQDTELFRCATDAVFPAAFLSEHKLNSGSEICDVQKKENRELKISEPIFRKK